MKWKAEVSGGLGMSNISSSIMENSVSPHCFTYLGQGIPNEVRYTIKIKYDC